MRSLPSQARVQLTEKGKTKEMDIRIENSEQDYFLIASESSKTIFKTKYPLKRVFVEIKPSDPTECTLSFITPTQEITFVFKTKEEANNYFQFISDKSQVHAENRAIEQLDKEMREIWPFPGGSFF